jgi:hypothetical protein
MSSPDDENKEPLSFKETISSKIEGATVSDVEIGRPLKRKRHSTSECVINIDEIASETDSNMALADASVCEERLSLAEGWQDLTAENEQVLVFNTKKVIPSGKIAGFDLDGCLIKTRSGAAFAKSADDWKLFCDEVKPKITQLFTDGDF